MLRRFNEILEKRGFVLFCIGLFSGFLFLGFVLGSGVWFLIGAVGFMVFYFQYVPHIGVKR